MEGGEGAEASALCFWVRGLPRTEGPPDPPCVPETCRGLPRRVQLLFLPKCPGVRGLRPRPPARYSSVGLELPLRGLERTGALPLFLLQCHGNCLLSVSGEWRRVTGGVPFCRVSRSPCKFSVLWFEVSARWTGFGVVVLGSCT